MTLFLSVQHPFQSIPSTLTNLLLLLLTLFTLLFILLLSKIGKPLCKLPVSPLGIVSLQFALEPTTAYRIIQSWGDAHKKAKQLFWLDFPFLVVYSLTLSLACIWITQFSTNSNWINIGLILAWGQGLAGLFDIVENLAMSPLLFRNIKDECKIRAIDQLLTKVTVVTATLKFSLIFAGLLYILISLAVQLPKIV